jgi:DeoR family fructose operon transcriptional repressor
VRFAELGDVDVVITDSGIPEADLEQLESAGVEVLVA